MARAYVVTIWGIALGILVFATGVVAVALSLGNQQLFKDGVDWVYDVVLYGIAADRLRARCAGREGSRRSPSAL